MTTDATPLTSLATPTATLPTRAGRREWIGLAVLALPCLLYVDGPDGAAPRGAVDQRADLEPSSTPAAVDHRHLRLHGRRASSITMGTLGDRIGRRRLLLIGAAAFGGASVLAAFSTSAEMLIASAGAARRRRRHAGAVDAVADPQHVPRPAAAHDARSAIWITSFSAGGAIGPLLGGVLLEHFWWGSVFLHRRAGDGRCCWSLGPMLLPEYRDPDAGRLDLPSAALSLAAVLAIIYGAQADRRRTVWRRSAVHRIVAGLAGRRARSCAASAAWPTR